MAYSLLFDNIAKAIDARFTVIAATHNFDLGNEFEIALCKLFRDILPAKYGICRGFVVTSDDRRAGDDIIIYDKDRFPTLRFIGDQSFAEKQDIPVEAVYAYVEAKHSVILEDVNSAQGLSKATAQCHNVQALGRTARPLLSVSPYLNMGDIFTAGDRPGWPARVNPMFTAIIARHVRLTKDSNILGSAEISHAVLLFKPPEGMNLPDLLVLGEKNLVLPMSNNGETTVFDSPFHVAGQTKHVHKTTIGSALAIGIASLLYALDTIQLGSMPFKDMIITQVNRK